MLPPCGENSAFFCLPQAMFSTEFLHIIRDYELEVVQRYFPAGARMLEIGGGTGYQAKVLSERGFKVSSIDLADSNYADDREFDVINYNGRDMPFEDDTFDLVFSSNVLEHVPDLPYMHREIQRVLKPGGVCIHVMPTASWRWWTSIAHYIDLVQRILLQMGPSRASAQVSNPSPPPPSPDRSGPLWNLARTLLRPLRRLAGVAVNTVKLVLHNILPPRHGEEGNAITELVTFSGRHWVQHFKQQGWQVMRVDPIGIGYTGHMVLGKRWPLASRMRWAKWMGSSCLIYEVKPPSASKSDAGAEANP